MQEPECQTDLEKLIFTIRTIHTVIQPIQFPKFWAEDWLKVIIDKLDSRKMTPDEKASLEILIARNAESVKAENRKIEAARMADKIETIKNPFSNPNRFTNSFTAYFLSIFSRWVGSPQLEQK